MLNYINVSVLKNHYKKFKPKGTWFNATEMRFFNTEIYEVCEVYAEDENFMGCLFITSEIFNGSYGGSEKKYSIRWLKTNGNVETIPEFFHYPTMHKAKKDFKIYLAQLETTGTIAG